MFYERKDTENVFDMPNFPFFEIQIQFEISLNLNEDIPFLGPGN